MRRLHDRLGPNHFLGEDGDLGRLLLQIRADLPGDRAEDREERLAQTRGVEWRDAEPVFVPVVVLLHVGAQLGVGGTATEEDLLVVHRHFLHREHRLGAEPADDEVGLLAGDRALHGVGGVGDGLDLVGVHAHQLDLQLLAADGDAALFVDFVASHLGARPRVLSLGEGHRSDDGDLDVVLRESGGRDGENGGRGDDERARHGTPEGRKKPRRRRDILTALRRTVEPLRPSVPHIGTLPC